jgi:hypothetical protein
MKDRRGEVERIIRMGRDRMDEGGRIRKVK